MVVAALSLPGLVLAGWIGWTLAEYLLHRVDMHGLGGRGTTSREHLDHHAGDPLVPRRSPTTWAGAVIVGLLLGWAGDPALSAGWVAGYAAYDLRHWSIHARPPRTRRQRRVWRHHLHHHFARPDANYGVTSAAWDIVFRSRVRPDRVPVPRPMAMPWLLDDDGRVRPGFAADYEVVDGPAW
jgi:hypothetical protein